ncbi:predicted protein, partial [Postia placenta Mad-698-R]
MGVQGLWDILNKAGQSRAFKNLTVVDGFEENESGRRAYRVGIDASIWYHHATFSKGGENPELRLFFFRLCKLLEFPLIPLFVFDGRERPKVKRGSKLGKAGSHNLTARVKQLLDCYGIEWRMARGEAEAELACLNRAGVIDAILTDDVDTLVFGARTVIKNPSLSLTGNKANPAQNYEGKTSKYHVMVFSAEALRNHPEVQMTRGGLVLFALLSGGDYDKGLNHFGPQIAHGLARLGFGDRLLEAYERQSGRNMTHFLSQWRAEINVELHTNAHKLLRCPYPSLSIPEDFPDMDVLRNYINPVCSASVGHQGGGALRDNGDLSIPRLAAFCEDHFGEWGHRSGILKRFRNVIWEASVIRVLRRAALEADELEKTKRIRAERTDTAIRGVLQLPTTEGVGTPASLVKKYLSPAEVDHRAAIFVQRNNNPAPLAGAEPDMYPMIRKILSARHHVSTDNLLEYRVEVDPRQLVALAESGIKGKHREPAGLANVSDDDSNEDDDEDATSSQGTNRRKRKKIKAPVDPQSMMRLWIPACMMRQVHPELVEDYEEAERAKLAKKNGAQRRRRK